MTDADFKYWLEYGGRAVVLVEVQTAQPRYLSTVPYTTLPTDTPSNRVYLPCIAEGVAFTEILPFDGSANLNAGDIALHNEDGSLDPWLLDVWVNREIKIFVGDIDWDRSDFRQVFEGVVAELTCANSTRINITMRDKLQRLNTPVSEALLGGSTPNKDRLVPISLGEVHNIEPLLADPATHSYKCHIGALERIIEVRSDGVPRLYTPTSGGFTLNAPPVGTITASVQGGSPYKNTVAGIVQSLATNYGNPTEKFSAGDLDTAQLASFDLDHPQPVGIHISDRANVLQVCQLLASSVGAQVVMSRAGKLRLLKIAATPVGIPVAIRPSDYEANTLAIARRSTVIAGVRLGYCKNWTVQSSVESGIPSEHKDLFAQEWLTATARDSTVATAYRLYAELAQIDTSLLKKVDADAEASRRLTQWKSPRIVYTFNGFASMLLLELGQYVTLFGHRYGLDSGLVGQVVALESDWINRRVRVEVLI